MTKRDIQDELQDMLRELHLPAIRECYQEHAQKAIGENLNYEQYLLTLLECECQTRRQNKIAKLLRSSHLPLEKNLEAFELKRLPAKVNQQVKSLLDGSFLDRKENVLAFGKPGSGKTHLLCAVSQELINQGRSVYFTKCDMVVEEMLRAKRDLKLDKFIKRLSRFDAMMIDDIGYVKQDRDEMAVLFTLLAERYERGSMLITSNLPFSQWESVFKDPMTTAAAIDRLVHHSVIIELNVPSYRMEQAKAKKDSDK
jgi:DNA replication protein DnaC